MTVGMEHIAFIMDGNRRWAKSNNLERADGHRQGVEALKKIVYSFQSLDSKTPIKIISVYALSKDNKEKRGLAQFNELMSLAEEFFDKFCNDKFIFENKIKFSIFGDYKQLPFNIVKKIDKAVENTKSHNKFFLNFCINYDGQHEIARACKLIAEKASSDKSVIQSINPEMVKQHLFTAQFPAPELIVRTGKEQRLSAFLLWDSSYSELYFLDKFWPDIKTDDVTQAISEYQNRNRRFGK